MPAVSLRQTVVNHQGKVLCGLLLAVCAGWLNTYVNQLRAESGAEMSGQWWQASRMAIHYTYAHDKDPESEDFALARQDMLDHARANPEGALALIDAAKHAGDWALQQQLIKEVANVSSSGRMAVIGDWLQDEVDDATDAVQGTLGKEVLLTQEQRSKLVDCSTRARQGKFQQTAFYAQRYGLPDLTGPAECQI